MGCTKAKRRRQEKISTVAGVVPTVPTVADHCTEGWLVTDIYKGEIFINTADNKAYTRGDSGIFEIGGGGSQTLSVSGNTLSISGGNSVAYEPYSVYTALLTQIGTDAPAATVLRNTLGVVGSAYNAIGNFSLTTSGLFTLNKTVVFIGSANDGDYGFQPSLCSARIKDINEVVIDVLAVPSDSGTNNAMLNTPIEIRVYP